MATVTFDKAQRWYPGSDVPAVPGLSLEIEDGEFMVLVGPSGCGKSTTLRMLAGLEEVNDGHDLHRRPRRDQHAAQGPRHRDGVPELRALPAHDRRRQHGLRAQDGQGAQRRAARAGREGGGAARPRRSTSTASPRQLSGGQRQRVAMGRAIVREPQVFCMDEPLSNLDAKMRVQTRTDIAKLQSDLEVTTVYVTHDQVEAMTMGDRVAVMKLGELQQVDTPLNLYDKPANLFVAGFIGSPQMNLLEGKASGGEARIGDYSVPVDPAAASKMDGDVTVGVRPEAWRIVSKESGGLPVDVTVVEELGADGFVYGTSDVAGTPHSIIIRVSDRDTVHKGDTLYVTTDPKHVHVFDTESGDRLSD